MSFINAVLKLNGLDKSEISMDSKTRKKYPIGSTEIDKVSLFNF